MYDPNYGILGFQPWLVMLVALLLVGGSFFLLRNIKNLRLQEKHRKLLEGRMVVDFYGKGGRVETYLCPEMKGTVELPKDYKGKKYTGDAKKLGAVKAPDGLELDAYFTLPEFNFDCWWPQGKPRSQQVEAKKTAFVVGIPLPIIWQNLEKWTPEMLETLASSLIGLSQDEDTLKALNAQDNTFWNNLEKWGVLLQQIPMMKIACFAAAGAAVLGAFLAFQAMSATNALIAMFAGG